MKFFAEEICAEEICAEEICAEYIFADAPNLGKSKVRKHLI